MTYDEEIAEAKLRDQMAHMRHRTSDPMHKWNLNPSDEVAMDWSVGQIVALKAENERLRKELAIFEAQWQRPSCQADQLADVDPFRDLERE